MKSLSLQVALFLAFPVYAGASAPPSTPGKTGCSVLLAWAAEDEPPAARRESAVEALGNCPPRADIRALLVDLIDGERPQLRRLALGALGPQLGRETLPTLLSVLERRGTGAAERLLALQHLSRSAERGAPPQAGTALLHVLRTKAGILDEHMAIRATAFTLTALGRMGDLLATPVLVEHGNSRYAEERLAALYALAMLWQGAQTSAPEAVLVLARERLQGPIPNEKMAAIKLLGTLAVNGNQKAAEELLMHRSPTPAFPARRGGEAALTRRRTLLYRLPKVTAEAVAVLGPGAPVYRYQAAPGHHSAVRGWVLIQVSGGRVGWLPLESLDFSVSHQSSLDTSARNSD